MSTLAWTNKEPSSFRSQRFQSLSSLRFLPSLLAILQPDHEQLDLSSCYNGSESLIVDSQRARFCLVWVPADVSEHSLLLLFSGKRSSKRDHFQLESAFFDDHDPTIRSHLLSLLTQNRNQLYSIEENVLRIHVRSFGHGLGSRWVASLQNSRRTSGENVTELNSNLSDFFALPSHPKVLQYYIYQESPCGNNAGGTVVGPDGEDVACEPAVS